MLTWKTSLICDDDDILIISTQKTSQKLHLIFKILTSQQLKHLLCLSMYALDHIVVKTPL